jgi:hypothetical protein
MCKQLDFCADGSTGKSEDVPLLFLRRTIAEHRLAVCVRPFVLPFTEPVLSTDLLYFQKHHIKSLVVDTAAFCEYNSRMKKLKRIKQGRPPKPPERAKAERLQIRVEPAEKLAFFEAASLVGQDVSVWVRDQLRRAARIALQDSGRPVPFLPSHQANDAVQ